MAHDDSCRKPGAVPFKWEIRPGVPKVQQHQQKQRQPPPQLSPPASPFINQRSLRSPPPGPPRRKLKPPPAASSYILSPEPRTHSFRSTPRGRSESFRFNQPTRLRPECVSPGCFPAPLLRRIGSKKRTQKLKPELDYVSEVEIRSRWSTSSRRSLSPFYSSPASSFSSIRSSPRLAADVEWAGFGFF
ncbi:uncharacterized protein LOC120180374 [Hibiscus syriacus]|uniref:uncharacterized protein LOC120180374 n=1 Tax=Hibiscus syriacus TaxID=106335 RepID=UPI001921F93E|nr:uncharacterized protein LOC120180374 [Hibiscus syriacus]